MKYALLILLFAFGMSSNLELTAQEDVQLVTLNLRYGTPADRENSWRERRKRVHTVFKKYEDGIIATQQILPLQIQDILKEVKALDVVYRSGSKEQDGGPANAIFYNKEKWSVVAHETFWFSDTPEVPASKSWGNSLPRTGNLTVFENTTTGRRIKIMNAHLDHRSENSRENSVELILRKLIAEADPMPTFLVGDFNVRPIDPIIERFEEFFVDTFEGDELAGCTFHDYHGGSHCPRYDYIFFLDDHGVSKTEYKIDKWNSRGKYPQDHYPVLATFRFEAVN